MKSRRGVCKRRGRAWRAIETARGAIIDVFDAGGLTKTALFLKLSACGWIRERRGLIITGPCGAGKSWLACALGQKACREDILQRRFIYHPSMPNAPLLRYFIHGPGMANVIARLRGRGDHEPRAWLLLLRYFV
jgi:IstB-like ATP binding protein